MNDDKDIDTSDLSRLRWMVFDIVKYDPVSSSTRCNDNSINSAFSYVSSRHYDSSCYIERMVIVMRRLLKPMYGHEARKQSQIDTNGQYVTIAFSGHPTCIDDKVFIDMSDRTMWLAVGDPISLDDFYKDVVSSDLRNDKYIGYKLDKDPSVGLVQLSQLRQSFVEWWCK